MDRNAGAIRLRAEAAKTGRGRTAMLEGDLAELIERRWEARLFEKDGNIRVAALVFHRDGEPVGDFRKASATACRAAGVPDKLFHDLRRTAAGGSLILLGLEFQIQADPVAVAAHGFRIHPRREPASASGHPHLRLG